MIIICTLFYNVLLCNKHKILYERDIIESALNKIRYVSNIVFVIYLKLLVITLCRNMY